jgi:small GTP-binding protein
VNTQAHAGDASTAEPHTWLLDTLEELLAVTQGIVARGERRHLDVARVRLAEDHFNLVVLGEFKRGKSTLINALLGRDVLPTGVLPLTTVVTTIRFGSRERILIRHVDGQEYERPLDELSAYVTEARNPANGLAVDSALVELDHPLLRAGLQLVDTPGIGSIHTHNTEVARGFLPCVDAALCVLDGGQPLSEAERKLFAEAAERVPRLLVAMNKMDHLEPGDRPAAIEFARAGLGKTWGTSEIEFFAVSARRGLGVAELRDRLQKLGGVERQALLLRSVAALARNVAADGAQSARFEARATQLPLEELSTRAARFERRIGELRAASAEAGDLLEQGVRRLIEKRINDALTNYARRESPRLRTGLHEYLESLDRRSPREISAEVERWIDSTVRGEFEQLVPQLEAEVAEELAELERRYAGRVERILEQVQDAADEVFGARASGVFPETGLRSPSRFTFKLRDVEHALEMIVGFGRSIAPGPLGRRLVARDAEQRLIAMTDRHAGRLRSELVERVSEAVRAYKRELASSVEEAIAAIQTAIQRAGDERRQGEASARGRLEELAGISRRCEQWAGELSALAAGAS